MKKKLAMRANRLRRISYLLFFLLTMSSLFLPARAGDGQILQAITVTVNIKSGTLESAIREIRKVTRVPFAYDKQLLSSYHIQGFSFSRETLENVLQKLL